MDNTCLWSMYLSACGSFHDFIDTRLLRTRKLLI